MKTNLHLRAGLLVLAVTALAVAIGGCVSRYRMDLFMVHGENRQKVDIEATAYVIDTRLNDPLAENKLGPSTTSSTVTISVGTRGTQTDKDLVLGFDEYLKYRIFIEIPTPLTPGPVELAGHSFVQMLKRYELPPEQKLYKPVSGRFVVDSVRESDLYASLQDGLWKNSIDSTVAFEGRLKIKIK